MWTLIWAALAGSWLARVVTVSLLAFTAFLGLRAYDRHVGRVEGRSEVVAEVTQKANDDAVQSDFIREAVAAAARDLRNPPADSPGRVRGKYERGPGD